MALVAYSEAAIEGIAARPGSPAWLEAEVSATRAGLLALRHNVILLRDSEDSQAFFPVRSPSSMLIYIFVVFISR